jgi:hypothetical protein
MLRLYDSLLSGNSWKVRILLSQLQLKYERVTLDLAIRDTHRPDFRKISRFSRIPALTIDDGRTIVESGAILTYLAEGTDLFPADSYLRAEVLSWLFFEQADLRKRLPSRGFTTSEAKLRRWPMKFGIAKTMDTPRSIIWRIGSCPANGSSRTVTRLPTSRALRTSPWLRKADIRWSDIRGSMRGWSGYGRPVAGCHFSNTSRSRRKPLPRTAFRDR